MSTAPTKSTPLPSRAKHDTRALGSTTNNPSKRAKPARARNNRLRDYAAALVPGERVAMCMRGSSPGKLGVTVMYSPDRKAAYLSDIFTCNRLWQCPCCAERITSKRREELSEGILAARRLGWSPVLVSVTMAHERFDSLFGVLAALQGAWSDLTEGGAYQTIKREWMLRGYIKALEITYGLNGWHAHFHIIYFTAADPKIFNVGGFQKVLSERWRHCLQMHGRDASDAHGIDVQHGDAAIAEYVAKFGREPQNAGWTASDEMTRGGSKKGRHGGLTPFQLLEIAGKGEDSDELLQSAGVVSSAAQAAALFREYVSAMHGKKQLYWSPGLRAALALAPELSDDAAGEVEVAQEDVAMVLIENGAWKHIVAAGRIADLLDIADTGDALLLRAWLWNTFRITRFDLKGY